MKPISSGEKLLFERRKDFTDRPGLRGDLDRRVFVEPLLDFAFGGHDRAVVAATEMLADLVVGRLRVLAGEEHCQHAGLTDRANPALRFEVFRFDTEQPADDSHHIGQSDDSQAVSFEISENVPCCGESDSLACHRVISLKAIECSFEFSHAVLKTLRHVLQGLGSEVTGQPRRFGFDDLLARGRVWDIESADETRQKPRPQFIAELCEQTRMSRTGQHDLATVIDQLGKRVQELFLKDPFRLKELDVIDEQRIDRAEALAKARQRFVAQGLSEVVGEGFRREEHHVGSWLRSLELSADSFEQVRLPRTDRTVNVERVELRRLSGGDLSRGGQCEFHRIK